MRLSADKKETGLIQIYTGNGKGKSTAAFGLTLRASGAGLSVSIVQFMKEGGWYSEIGVLRQLANVEIYSYGIGKFIRKGTPPDEGSLRLAAEAMAKARELLADESVDVLILDELCNAVYFELITEEDALSLLDAKRADQELVLTGRNATEKLIERADLVTEMREIKHPFKQGIKARKGIEY